MKIQLTADETKDLSRQLRFLYVRELRENGFKDTESFATTNIAHPMIWIFEKPFPELENYSAVQHSESVTGDYLIQEAMVRVEQEENIIPRTITERYIGKLREAVRRMAIKQAVEWKRVVENHAIRFITHREPLHTYLEEKVIARIWNNPY